LSVEFFLELLKNQGVSGMLLAVLIWQNSEFFKKTTELISMCRDCKYRIKGVDDD